MGALLQDVRFALRMLRKSPAFTAVAALTILVGTAAVTTIFSFANTLLLTPNAAIGAPEALVTLHRTDARGRGYGMFSHPLYADLRDGARTLEGVAGYALAGADVGVGGDREHVTGYLVTGNYFDVLRVRPAAGRFFAPDEDRAPMAAPVAVISHRFWRERLAGDPRVAGREIEVNGRTFTIVGVAPEGFGGTISFLEADLFVPGMMYEAVRRGSGHVVADRKTGWLTLIGRAREGVGRGAVQAEVAQLAKASEAAAGLSTDELGVRVGELLPIPSSASGPVTIFMGVLFTVAALVLIIASVNVANMLLARGVARRKEMVVRLALGASRMQLVRQLLVESVALFLVGGAGGVLATWGVLQWVARAQITIDFPVTPRFPIDGTVLGFTLLSSLVTGIVFGLVPALQASRRDLAGALRSDGAGAGDRRQRLRSALVVAQLATSVVLLVAAGLFVRAFQKGKMVDPGFRIANVATATIDLAAAGYDGPRARAVYAELARRLTSSREASAVAFSQLLPLTGTGRSSAVTVPGHQPPPGMKFIPMPLHAVGDGYFQTLGVPLVRGRDFGPADTPEAPPSAIVTEAFAARFWPAGGTGDAASNALGKTFAIEGRTFTVVGVARDARFHSIAEAPEPYVFISDRQEPNASMTLVARTAGDPALLSAALRREMAAIDPKLTAPAIRSLEDAASIGLLPQRIAASVTGILGGIGILLATVGLYGVVAYGVSQRTRELCVRMALGASPSRVAGMVVAGGARLAATGLGIGLVLSVGGSEALIAALGGSDAKGPAVLLQGVSALDPVSLVGVPALLMLVALGASWAPAWRAGRLELGAMLRGE